MYIYVKTGLHIFYRKIYVKNVQKIPKNDAVLFVANHQNAMMDPILIATHNTRVLYFLARASAFKNKLAAKLLNAIHAIAIFRVRDGVNSKKLNVKVFEKCVELLSKKQTILIFPEGSHSVKRQIRSLRSGFSQISYDFLSKNPNHKLYIVPVGLNFTDTLGYPEEVAIIYGDKIEANTFYEADYRKFTGKIIKEVSASLQALTVHIPKENYEKILEKLDKSEYLTPQKTNAKIRDLSSFKIVNNSGKPKRKRNIFYYLLFINTLFAFLFWHWLKPKIKEKEFISTAKFSIGLTIFPLEYLAKSVFIFYFFNLKMAIIYIILSVFVVFLSTKTN